MIFHENLSSENHSVICGYRWMYRYDEGNSRFSHPLCKTGISNQRVSYTSASQPVNQNCLRIVKRNFRILVGSTLQNPTTFLLKLNIFLHRTFYITSPFYYLLRL
jgi:hypothetical protein